MEAYQKTATEVSRSFPRPASFSSCSAPNSPYTCSEHMHSLSLTEICETLVMSCSDQQVFTGGAYAISLRYWNGCSITAYHYNIVANMMLLTCATHLMSVTIVRNYYKSLWQSILRVVIIVGVVLVTGIILSNQDANTDIQFPTTPPPQNETDMGLLFLPAACFQGQDTHIVNTLQESFNGTDDFQRSILFSTAGGGNHIQGWNEYIIMLAWYVLSLLVMLVRWFYHIQRDVGFAAATGRTFIPCCFPNRKPDKEEEEEGSETTSHIAFRCIHTFYMLIGVAIGSATVFTSAGFIMKLRAWAKQSGWLQPGGINGQGSVNQEDDSTSFGQLVPMFLSLLTIFTLAQTVNGEQFPYLALNSFLYCPYTNPDIVSAMWDKRHSRRHPSVVSQTNNIAGSPDFQKNSPRKNSPVVLDMGVPVATSRSTFGHQYPWVQGPNTPQTQSVMSYAESMRPTISQSVLYTAPTAVSACPVHSSHEFGSPMQDASLNNHAVDTETSIPPVSLDSGSPPQLRHTPYSFSTMSCPSSQPLLQNSAFWGQPSPEWTYFPVQTPPRSGSNLSSPRNDV